MFIRATFLLALALLCATPAMARGGGGGHNTTFDCNVWGGSCACFMSAASGRCGNATAHYSNATCNGGDDSAALADWITYGHGRGASIAVLFIPPGCTEGVFGGDGNNSFIADVTVHCAGFGAQPITTIQNAVIWAYGATLDSTVFGGAAFFNAQNTQGVETGCGSGPTNTSPLLQAANAGDTTLTLITAADASNFAAGDHVVVSSIGTQGIGSFPPNPQIFEHKLLTGVNVGTGVLTLDAPLKFSYKTTYPNIGGTQPFEGGPATVYLMEKTYNNISQFFGMTVTSSAQANIIGRSVSLTDVVVVSGSVAPSQSESVFLSGGFLNDQEVDKNVDLLSENRVNGNTLTVQSAAVNSMVVQGTTMSRFWNGSPLNASITNSKAASFLAGPTCCGQASALTVDGFSFATATVNYHHTLISAYSFSGGTLTIAKSNPEYTNGTSPGIWVPGHKYFVGDSDGSNSCSPANTFTVTDLQDSGSNVSIVTTLGSVSFGNTCGAGTRAPTTFGSYQVMSLTQLNVPAGTPSLTSNPEMLPP